MKKYEEERKPKVELPKEEPVVKNIKKPGKPEVKKVEEPIVTEIKSEDMNLKNETFEYKSIIKESEDVS